MSYTPQPGNNIILEFGYPNPYTPQSGSNVIIEFGEFNVTFAPFLFFMAPVQGG